MSSVERRSVRRPATNATMAMGDDVRYELLPSESNVTGRPKSLKGDYINVFVLLFLYILQGIPLGLAGAIPLILQNRKVSYSDQAVFSFVSWPFSIKLLWAPIVDSLYSHRFGRRKSWLVPIQYLIGIFLILLSPTVKSTLDSTSPNIYLLTMIFLCMNLLAATQDIAVDGWALTMLQRHNVGYASTCNSVGQTAGYFLGNIVFLALESTDFCNKYLRSEPTNEGLVSLSGFMYFWGIVFLVTTTLVMVLKRESSQGSADEPDLGIVDTYKMLYRILCLPSVKMFVVILLTCKMGFGTTDSVTGLKLIESGIHKEHLALLAVPLIPLQIILPWIISKYTAGPRPLDVFLRAYPFRLFFGVMFAGLLYWTQFVKNADGSFPAYYYLAILTGYALHQIAVYSMFVAIMAFHAKTSDPEIGGTYMTLLNTVTNLGGNWPQTLSLWLVDPFTLKNCSVDSLSCSSKLASQICEANGGTCSVFLDGYYIEVLVSVVIGIMWLKFGRSKVTRLQLLPPSSWKCP